jgi:hypothetical protein
MRRAVIATLKALYKGKEVTANRSLECDTTRITNEICILRNTLGVKIITDRINTENGWYGCYRLIRTPENISKTIAILNSYDIGES